MKFKGKENAAKKAGRVLILMVKQEGGGDGVGRWLVWSTSSNGVSQGSSRRLESRGKKKISARVQNWENQDQNLVCAPVKRMRGAVLKF